jgi:hypothetical protein
VCKRLRAAQCNRGVVTSGATSPPGLLSSSLTKGLLRKRAKSNARSHLQQLGMHQARYPRQTQTRLQVLLAATVANFAQLDVLGVFDAAAR